MIGAPPSAPATTETTAERSPLLALTPAGAAGSPAGVAGPSAGVQGTCATALTAATSHA